VFRATIVTFFGLTLGVATAYAQGWLPPEMGSFANSVGSWALLAFLLALLADDTRAAAVLGFLALATLLAGYVLGAHVRGDASSSAFVAFWGLSALIAGPILGIGANWLKDGRPNRCAIGVGVMSGVLVGEGIYGLTIIAGTTYPPYWWAEVCVGVILLCWVAARRLRQRRPIALAVGCSLGVAAAFVVIFSQDLISIFP
jgi:hypothetical protein